MAKDFDLKWHSLTEDEFQALAYDAYSCIGAEDVDHLIRLIAVQLRVS